jgi:hypothetical protein
MKCLDFTFSYLYKDLLFDSRKELINKFGEAALDTKIFSEYDFSNIDIKLSFTQAVKNSLKRITNKNDEIYILYSGGIDSEVLLSIAVNEGYRVHAVTTFIKDLNDYDVDKATSFIKNIDVLSHRIVEVSLDEYQEKWLPQLIWDIESPSYILGAAYIALRSCPKGKTILIGGEGPTLISCINRKLYYSNNEYDLMPLKMNALGYKVYDLFWDAQVYSSFLEYTCIKERIFQEELPDNWCFNSLYLNKEYFYTDPDLAHLKRRFSLSGWEKVEGPNGYYKGTLIGQSDISSSIVRHQKYTSYLDVDAISTNLITTFLKGEQCTLSELKELLLDTSPSSSFSCVFDDLTRAFYVPIPENSSEGNNSLSSCVTNYYGEVEALK